MPDEVIQHVSRLGDMGYRRAVFSPCRKYRYALVDVWDKALPLVAFVMLNPSTADAMVNDPTVRRCLGYAARWGYGGLGVFNLFALRSTDPAALYDHPDPVGPGNNAKLAAALGAYRQVICAWGVHGEHGERWREVEDLLRAMDIEPWCLGVTLAGHPKHPLYLKADLQPVLLRDARRELKEACRG